MQGLKIRVPDVPAYLAMPRACGANTTPIAFAEVYLALQNGTVEAQENPLTTIEAKKFYEVQKNIVLTGHIVDHLNTVVSKQPVVQALGRRQADLHRSHAGGRRAQHQDHRGREKSARRGLQGRRPHGRPKSTRPTSRRPSWKK
jgi:TRAP-type C4-dicarboxylate transport system substrate-binding protein